MNKSFHVHRWNFFAGGHDDDLLQPAGDIKMACFVEATKYFLDNPAFAEKYVRESMFKNQVSSQEYCEAMDNASLTYDITVDHVQLTTDYMVKYGIGKMSSPPKAKDWVRLDLLDAAKKGQGVK